MNGAFSRGLRLAIAVLAVIGIASIAWVRATQRPYVTAEESNSRKAAAGRQHYRSVPMLTLPAERDTIAKALRNSTARNLEMVGKERGQAVLAELADFLYYRFSQPSAVIYRRWREQFVDSMQSREYMEQWWTIDEQCRQYGGRLDAASMSMQEIFDLLWTSKAAKDARPMALAQDPAGVAITFGEMTRGNPVRQMVSGRWSGEIWHGGISSTHASWWVPRRPYSHLLEREGRVLYAECGVVMEYSDRDRRPMIFTFIWDPVDSRWDLQIVNTNNTPDVYVSAIDY